jgi:hypothetical protein
VDNRRHSRFLSRIILLLLSVCILRIFYLSLPNDVFATIAYEEGYDPQDPTSVKW